MYFEIQHYTHLMHNPRKKVTKQQYILSAIAKKGGTYVNTKGSIP